MRKLLSLAPAIMIVYLSLTQRQSVFIPPEKFQLSTTITPPEVEAADIDQTKFYPNRLLIPAINLNAAILALGAESDGRMAVPPDNKTASWWVYGTIPGEKGSAVFAGHYKIDNGSPGVFHNLTKVKKGDLVTVINHLGEDEHFKIEKLAIYKENEFPVKDVYASKDGKRLNLVTCTGEFISSKNDYTHRLVVYAVSQN